MLFLPLILCVLCDRISSQDISFTEDVRALSELPLEKLLHIKKNFDGEDFIVSESNATSEVPQALPLQSKASAKDREVYHYEEPSYDKDKSSSIQKIFQLSITTLAFLAFGGYLICLLVQAIKGKSNNYQTTATQIMSALLNAQIKRRRPTRTPYRRQQKPTSNYRRKPRSKREISKEWDLDSMYYSLINLSEGYTKYHTEDYFRYNYSSSYF